MVGDVNTEPEGDGVLARRPSPVRLGTSRERLGHEPHFLERVSGHLRLENQLVALDGMVDEEIAVRVLDDGALRDCG
jgi:hypothetical protein